MNCQVFLDRSIVLKIVFFVDIGLYFESALCKICILLSVDSPLSGWYTTISFLSATDGAFFFIFRSCPQTGLKLRVLSFIFIHLCTKYSFENSDCQ